MNFTPLADRVLIEPIEQENVTKGGIIIPDIAKEKPKTGKVIKVGTSIEGVKEEDTVLYEQFAGTEISIEGKSYLVMRESNIMAVI